MLLGPFGHSRLAHLLVGFVSYSRISAPFRVLVLSSQYVHTEMKAYRLYTVVPRLVEFIEQLTNVYVRLNRNRLKGAEGAETARAGEGAPFLVSKRCARWKGCLSYREVTRHACIMFRSPFMCGHGMAWC